MVCGAQHTLSSLAFWKHAGHASYTTVPTCSKSHGHPTCTCNSRVGAGTTHLATHLATQNMEATCKQCASSATNQAKQSVCTATQDHLRSHATHMPIVLALLLHLSQGGVRRLHPKQPVGSSGNQLQLPLVSRLGRLGLARLRCRCWLSGAVDDVDGGVGDCDGCGGYWTDGRAKWVGGEKSSCTAEAARGGVSRSVCLLLAAAEVGWSLRVSWGDALWCVPVQPAMRATYQVCWLLAG